MEGSDASKRKGSPRPVRPPGAVSYTHLDVYKRQGYTYSQTRTVVKNLVGTCLGSVEITMNTPGALESIRKISQEFGAQIMVGAGTVLTCLLYTSRCV